jgi:hypothetical protein
MVQGDLYAGIEYIFAYIFYQLKKNVRSDYISRNYAKEIIRRTLKNGGIPNIGISKTIFNMIRKKLLVRNGQKMLVLTNHPCYKLIKEELESFI